MSYPHPQPGQKRAADTSEDGRDSKRLQSGSSSASRQPSEQAVEPFLIKEVRDASADQIFGAAPGLSARRYDQDLLHVWDSISISDATAKEMREAWFQCRKHGLIDQLWALRSPSVPEVRRSDKKPILKTIATFEEMHRIAETNQQEDIVHAVSIVLLDYIMVMVVFYSEKSNMEEPLRIFPNHKERFAELIQRIGTKPSAVAVPLPRPAQPSATTTQTASIPEDTRALINSMRVPTKAGPGLEEIVGSDEARDIITQAASLHTEYSHLVGNLNCYRSLLLHGPPGTGKTTMAMSVAGAEQCALYIVSSSSLMNQYVGNSEKNVAALFKIAQENAPAIIFFDEFDGLFAVGDKPESEIGRRVTAQLLVSMTQSFLGVTVIAVTNLPWLISTRLLRRFDVKYHVTLPSTEEITRILRLKIQSLSYHLLTEEQIQQLGQAMAGFTGDDVQRAVRMAWNTGLGRLRRASPTHFRNVEFQGQTVAIACLPHEVDALVIQGSSTRLSPGPTTPEDMEAAIDKVKAFARKWGNEEARHAAWAKDPESMEMTMQPATSGQVLENRSLPS